MRSSRATLTPLFVAAIACAGCEKGLKYSECAGAKLTEPWIGLEISSAGGRVCRSSEGGLTMQFVAGTKDELERRTRDELVAQGFRLTECQKPKKHRKKVESSACRYLKGKQEIVLRIQQLWWKSSEASTLSADYSFTDYERSKRRFEPTLWGDDGEVIAPVGPAR